MTRRSPTLTIGLTSKPPRPNNKTHIMLPQQPVLAEQCHDKGLRRRLLRPYPCRPSVACSDSSPQRGEPEKHLPRDVELELGVLPVFFVLPCRGYSIASQGCIAIKRFHKLAYRWQIRKADRRHLAYVWQFIPARPQLGVHNYPLTGLSQKRAATYKRNTSGRTPESAIYKTTCQKSNSSRSANHHYITLDLVYIQHLSYP